MSLFLTLSQTHILGKPPALLWCTLTARPAACLEQSQSSDNVLFSLWTFLTDTRVQTCTHKRFYLFLPGSSFLLAHPYHTHRNTCYIYCTLVLMHFTCGCWRCWGLKNLSTEQRQNAHTAYKCRDTYKWQKGSHVLHNITHSMKNSGAKGIKITTLLGSSTSLKQSRQVLPETDKWVMHVCV